MLLEPVGTTPVAQTREKILFSYTVRPGDTLWDISKWVLKNPFLWPELLKYNYFGDPNLIFPGDTIIIPGLEVLEKVKSVRDISELQALREETEAGAQVVALEPPTETGKAAGPASAPGAAWPVTPAAESEVRVPWVEAQGASLAGSELKITGRKNINFNYREYRGGVAPYYFSSGYTRQESLHLKLAGQLENTVKVEGDFYQSDQELESTYSLKLATDHMELFLGDFTALLPDTQFLLRDRSLSGGRFSADFGNVGGVAMAAAAKGVARYERFYGNRTQGPYALGSAPVVFGSETVRLNKRPLTRGEDYTLDYYTGQVKFLKSSVDDISLVEVTYESRQTVYSRSLYAGRVWAKPTERIRLGASAAHEEDPANVETVALAGGNTLTPVNHWVVGCDLQAEWPEFGTWSAEWAGSRFQSDRRLPDAEQGQAGQTRLSGSVGPIGLNGYYRRTLPGFHMIGGLDEGVDLLNFGGEVDVKTGGPYSGGGNYDFKEQVLEGFRQTTEQALVKAGIRPLPWSGVGYQYFQLLERGQALSPLRRNYVTRRHTGVLEVSQEYWNAGVRGEQEQRLGELADRGSALTRSLVLSAGTQNIRWANLSASLEHQVVSSEGSSLTTAAVYRVTKAQTTGSLTPWERYSLTVDNRWVWDEQYGSTQTLDSKLRAVPVDAIRLDAKYAWETLQSLLGSEYRAVYTQTAAGQLELLPWAFWSLRTTPSLRWTTVADSGRTLNLNRLDLVATKWAMVIPLTHELELKRDLYWLADSTDPDLRRQTEQETRAASYACRMAWSNLLAGEATAAYEQYYKLNFNLAANADDRLSGRHRTFGMGLRSSLDQTLRLEGNYALDLRDQHGSSPQSVTRTAYPITSTGQTTDQYNLLNSYGFIRTRQDTGMAKITFQLTEAFSISTEGTYNRNEDLSGQAGIIHTAAPGAGAVWRQDRFRLEANAKWAKSWGALETWQEAYTAVLSYTPLEMLALSLQAQNSRTVSPNSSATEINLNCSVQF
ncbi:MAG: LysM peptidoglycan-binding domain-containing protein [candidate division FCPU426 bacterium]